MDPRVSLPSQSMITSWADDSSRYTLIGGLTAEAVASDLMATWVVQGVVWRDGATYDRYASECRKWGSA